MEKSKIERYLKTEKKRNSSLSCNWELIRQETINETLEELKRNNKHG